VTRPLLRAIIGLVFSLFKRKSKRALQRRVAVDASQLRAGADVQMMAKGGLPEDVAAGGQQHEPVPEYIAGAATPSEDMWAREQARYRAKLEGKQPD